MADVDVKTVPHTKGGSFPDTIAVVRENLGDERFAEFMGRMPGAFREAHELNSILPTVWYPLEWELCMHRVYAEMSGGGLEACEALGHESAMRNFSGIYRIFFRLLQPQTLFAKAGTIFNQFYSAGGFELLDKGPGFARCRFTSPGFDSRMWADARGACRAALEVCGAKAVELQYESGGGDGDDTAVLCGAWKV